MVKMRNTFTCLSALSLSKATFFRSHSVKQTRPNAQGSPSLSEAAPDVEKQSDQLIETQEQPQGISGESVQPAKTKKHRGAKNRKSVYPQALSQATSAVLVARSFDFAGRTWVLPPWSRVQTWLPWIGVVLLGAILRF